MFEIKIQENDLFDVISLLGDLDLSSSYKLKDTVTSLFYEDVNNIIIDCTDLNYIDSSGIGALLRINSQFNIPGKSMWLINITGQVKDIIQLVRLNEYFPITTYNDAVENIKKNSKSG